MSKLDKLSSNQYYGGKRRRFQRRAELLKRLGFTYENPRVALYEGKEVDCPVAVFIRRKYGKVFAIPAVALHHADKRAWFDLLYTNLR